MAESVIEMSVEEVISTEHGDIIIPLVDTDGIELVKVEKGNNEIGVVEFEVTTTHDVLLPEGDHGGNLTELLPVTETIESIAEHVQKDDAKPEFKPMVSSTPTPSNTAQAAKKTLPKVEQLVDLPLRPRTKLLYSNILSNDEIAKEFLARQAQKRQTQMPQVGDVLFKKQLTRRLAEKVVKEETLNPHINIEMMTPPPPPKLPKLNDTPDMDAQMLLQILEEGAESHYPEPQGKVQTPKLPKYVKTEEDREMEKQIALKQLMEFNNESKKKSPKENNNNAKPKKRLNSEVQRLLQDEGAINMLYSIEKGENVKATALPSKRRMKKALQKKAQEVQQAVLEGSTQKKGLRLRTPVKDAEVEIKKEPVEVKKEPVEVVTAEKKEDGSSPEKNDFVAPSPSTPNASKIIRRHSSSSSYSGNNSPIRRISMDESGKSDSEKVVENGVPHETKKTPIRGKKVVKLVQKTLTNSVMKKVSTPKKGVNGKPKIIKKKTKSPTPVAGTSKSLDSETSKIDLPEQNGFKEKLQMEFSNKIKSIIKKEKNQAKDTILNKQMLKPSKKVDKEMLQQNKSLTCEAIWQMLQDDWNMGEDPDDPSPFIVSRDEDDDDDRSPDNSVCGDDINPILGHKSEIAPLPMSEPELDIIPENKSEVPFSHQYGSSSYMYQELMLRKIGPLTHVNIAPISTNLPQAFNQQVLKELCSVMEICSSDSRCKCLLLTSSGSLFSSGVDLPCLLANDSQSRSNMAKTMAAAVKEFTNKLAMFSKMIVAGVSGPCVGLGVAMLPMCDVVISSPKAVYLTPYASLGYIPEAASTLTLPAIIGHRMASSMLIGGRKLSAEEAVNCGLVTQLLPDDNFANQVLELAFNIASQSVQSMESTKALMMHSIRSRLNNTLVAESALLQQHWLTLDCQNRIKEKADKLLNE